MLTRCRTSTWRSAAACGRVPRSKLLSTDAATSNAQEITPAQMAQALAADPKKLEAFVAALPNEQKKVVGLRWAMAELEDEFAKADFDKDGDLSYREFHQWATKTVDSGPQSANEKVTPAQLRSLTIQTIVPFIGFGIADNSIMVLSGDLIDSTIGVSLGISTLAAAALGNAFSNSLGMGLHGTIEVPRPHPPPRPARRRPAPPDAPADERARSRLVQRFATRIGLPDPRLTVSQRRARVVKNVKMASGVAGVLIGCCLGMFPLLFMKRDEQKVADLKRTMTGGAGDLTSDAS